MKHHFDYFYKSSIPYKSKMGTSTNDLMNNTKLVWLELKVAEVFNTDINLLLGIITTHIEVSILNLYPLASSHLTPLPSNVYAVRNQVMALLGTH